MGSEMCIRDRALLRQKCEPLNQAVIDRLIESMSSRIRQVIELFGEVTKFVLSVNASWAPLTAK